METSNRPRADRVTLEIPITYHRPGDDHWFEAKVFNLSASGVLFGPSELEGGGAGRGHPLTADSGQRVCERQTGVRGTSDRITETHTVAARFEECRFLLED